MSFGAIALMKAAIEMEWKAPYDEKDKPKWMPRTVELTSSARTALPVVLLMEKFHQDLKLLNAVTIN